jgi:glycosyltransferase involved in cell wall biosynthesis
MRNYPLVSIVLATYNGEKFLHQQIDSLLAQSYPNIEIIAIDDASVDDTAKILKGYATQHQHIKVYINETNLGFVRNFDKGCGLSTGKFIALCDQDDYWHPDKLSRLVEAIGERSMIYCDSYLCNQDLKKIGKKASDIVNFRSFDNCLQQAIFCRIYGHATLFTRALYTLAHPFIQAIPHDWWLSYTATLLNGITYLPEPMVYYRQHSTNLIGAVGGKKRKHLNQNKKEKRRFEKINIRSRINDFYNICPQDKIKEKKVLFKLLISYKDFSLLNNLRRVLIFLQYRNTFLMAKKHSALHRFFFCLKIFATII